MRKTEIAKAVNRSAPSGFLTTVLASDVLEVPKVRLAAFACLHCNTQFASLSKTKPFCITCGAEEVVDLSTEKEPEMLEDESELTGITCASCGTHNLMSNRVAASLNGHAHCITCGEDLDYSAPEGVEDQANQPEDLVFSDTEDGDDLEQEENASEQYKKALNKAKRIKENKSEADIFEVLDDQEEEPIVEDLELLEKDKSEAKVKHKVPKHSSKQSKAKRPDEEHKSKDRKRNKSTAEVDVTFEDEDGESIGIEVEENDGKTQVRVKENEGGEDTDSGSDEGDVPVNLEEVTPEEGTFDVAQTAHDRVTATVNNIPVAYLIKDKVDAELWGKTNWLRSIKQIAATHGRKKALSHFNFDPIVINFPLKNRIQQAALMQTEKYSRVVEARVSDLREDYKQAIAIAAAGLNKGFFKNKENVLKAAFYDELCSVGVTKPAALVDKVFAAVGEKFLSTLLELAEELIEKPIEIRNQLSDTVEAANYMHSTPDSESENEETLDVRARLNNAVTPEFSYEVSASLGKGGSLFGK